MFLLYINDLPNGLNNIVKLFADDLKLIGNAKFPNLIEQDLRLLEEWENQWLLRFNPTKCKVMHIDFNRNPSSYNDYFLNGVTLDTISTEKDLGIIFDKSLKWDKNINSAISKANKMIAWVARNFITREKSVMINIYKALIRPHLEYCVQIWSPAAQHGNWGLILEIEQVQRRFTRMIDGIGTLPYSQRLEALNLTTLAERRIRGDIIETFKIVNNLVDYGQMSYTVSQSSLNLVNRSLHSGNNKVDKLYNRFLPQRVNAYWNKIPKDVRASDDVLDFKIKLENFKKSTKNSNLLGPNNYFWEVSDMVLDKIESGNYLSNKGKFNDFLQSNPYFAKKNFINMK